MPQTTAALASAVEMARVGDAAVDRRRRETWDDLVAEDGGQPLQSWAWGELKAGFGWKPFRLASADGRARAQLLIRPHPYLGIAYVPRGPLLSGDAAVDRALIDAIVRVAKVNGAAFLRLEPDILEGEPAAAAICASLRDAGFRRSEHTLQPRSSIRLDLTPTSKQLLAAFSKGHRADIRRAERDGVTIRAGAPADAGILEQMLIATNQRKTFGIRPAAYYRRLLESFGERARLLIAEVGAQPVAASLVLAFGRHGMYLAAGSSVAGLEHRAAHLLQWHAIRWAKGRGALTWDLWGIADARGRHELATGDGSLTEAALAELEAEAERDPLDGVYRFKKGWGGRVVRTLPAFDRVFSAPAYWLWQWRRGDAGS